MTTHASTRRYTPVWDRTGIVLSALCLIHCLGAPLAILFLPAFGLALAPADVAVHAVLATVVPITALLAFVPGYRRHRNSRIVYAASAGVGAIVAAAFLLPEDAGTAAETFMTVLGGVLLIVAHLRNHAFCRRCPVCTPATAPGGPSISVERADR
jgi:hypothetical protein